MGSLATLLTVFKGYRTYLSAAAAILTAIATVCGVLDPTQGAAIAAACVGLAQVFQRVATADHQLTLSEMSQDVADLAKAVKPLMVVAASNSQVNLLPTAQPAAIPENGSQPG